MYKILGKKTARSKKYEKIVAQYINIEEVAEYARQIGYGEKPYIFTHIPLNDGTIIMQEVMGLICSPTKLSEMLGMK